MGTEDQKKHRERLRKRFLDNNSLDSFADHEIIEMLLFYSVKQRDTKELAYRILEEFSTLDNLMNATPAEIAVRCNVSQNTAMVFSVMNHVLKRSLRSKYESKTCFNSFEDLGKFAVSLLYGDTVENLYVICMDNKSRLIAETKIASGTINRIEIYTRHIVSFVLSHKTSYVALAHNHPSGVIFPSREDINLTNSIMEILEGIEVELIDHIIVGRDDFYSFAEKRMLNLQYPKKSSPQQSSLQAADLLSDVDKI